MLYDLMAGPLGNAQCSIALSGSRQPRCRGRRGRREPRLLPPQPCSVRLPLSTVQRLVVCVLPVRIRIRSLLQLEQEHWASVGTFPATSVARAASFGSSASGVSTTIEPIPKDTMLPWDTTPQWDAVDTVQMRDAVPLRDTVPLRGTMPLPDTVPLRDAMPQWDTVPLHGVGYDGQHAACSSRRAA